MCSVLKERHHPKFPSFHVLIRLLYERETQISGVGVLIRAENILRLRVRIRLFVS